MRRLLLPFTHGIDGPALDYAFLFARQTQATLVVGSWLTRSTDRKSQRPLPGHIEQSQDFLILADYKARRFQVPVESIEFYSIDSAKSMQALSSEMECDAILLFMRHKKALLISHEEMQQLLFNSHIPLLIVSLPLRYPTWQRWKERSIFWLSRMSRASKKKPALMPQT
ncbi:hypothetical protein [Dictyobacter aurantiacus]|uniref:UspA domain-containing protein n=1 Tax=Dictyobacter aurantiacus TaxID=1936993 RepID=A0A401Z7H5_9CHLR|nr:hypothetical protein [Dictyobacter aurantiacus]GCE02802.1 hypothetical protein KDAU_01310 [Dictyobacter aurantiacus]